MICKLLTLTIELQTTQTNSWMNQLKVDLGRDRGHQINQTQLLKNKSIEAGHHFFLQDQKHWVQSEACRIIRKIKQSNLHSQPLKEAEEVFILETILTLEPKGILLIQLLQTQTSVEHLDLDLGQDHMIISHYSQKDQSMLFKINTKLTV